MHRFVWDLHGTPPDALDHGYPISAIVHDTPREPSGVRALPGRYTARLTVAGKSYTQSFELKMDPRVKATPEALAAQFRAESDAVSGINETTAALKQLQALRAQLKDRAQKAGPGPLADAIAALDKQLGALEGERRQAFFGLPPAGKEKENLSSLNQQFGSLLRTADSCDCALTAQAAALQTELNTARRSLAADWERIRTRDASEINERLTKAGMEPVSVK